MWVGNLTLKGNAKVRKNWPGLGNMDSYSLDTLNCQVVDTKKNTHVLSLCPHWQLLTMRMIHLGLYSAHSKLDEEKGAG